MDPAIPLLNELNRLAAAAANPAASGDGRQSPDFATVFKSFLDGANAAQTAAAGQARAFEVGDSDDLTGVMITLQRARLSFQSVLQVRNRLVSAYQDIMNMPM